MLDKYEELDFISSLNLPKMKQIPSGYNFQCVFCNEGHSKGRKKRAYLLINNRDKGNRYFCHNCGKSVSFKTFLEEYDHGLFLKYLDKERESKIKGLKNGSITWGKKQTIKYESKKNEIEYINLKEFPFIKVIQNNKAIEYLNRRRIPKKYFTSLYYCPIFSDDWGKYPFQDMVIFPFYDGEVNVYGFQGRSINRKLFHTHSLEGFKIYNIFNVDKNSRVYVFESIIDSMYIDNSVAILGSTVSKDFFSEIKDVVYCFDNDRTDVSYEKLEKLVNDGEQVFIWPDNIKQKDIGDLIEDDWTQTDIITLIDRHVVTGTKALVTIGLKKTRKRKKSYDAS